MSTTILGKVACVPRGAYSSTATYNPLDIISYAGSSYLVITACSGITPPNTAYYMLLAERGAAGEDGVPGPAGATGSKGDKGDPGTGLEIQGTYASLDALKAGVTSPKQGDMYNVGTASPYTIYMYDITNGVVQWISQGQLQGAKGDTGASGVTFTPSISSAGVLSWTNDGNKTNPASVSVIGPQGPRGETGSPGATFTPSVSSAGVLSWTNNGGLNNPASVNIKGPQGDTGATATINGVNALTIAAGDGLALSQSGATATLSLDLDNYDGGAF